MTRRLSVIAAALIAALSLSLVSAWAQENEGEAGVFTPIERFYGGQLPNGATVVNDYTIRLRSGDLAGINAVALFDAAGPEIIQATKAEGDQVVEPLDVDDCISQFQCWWEHSQFTGQIFAVHDVGNNGVPWTDVPANFNNEMSSWRNHDSQDAKWAKGQNGGGEQNCMDGNSRDSYVGDADNDTMTSYRVFDVDANPC